MPKKSTPAVATVAEYRVVADGINWPNPEAPAPAEPAIYGRADHRAERGDMVRLPPEYAQGFLESGHIESLEEQQQPTPEQPEPPAAASQVKE